MTTFTEIRLSADKTALTLVDEQGAKHTLAAEYLRVESPSAEVKGHGIGQEMLVPGKAGVQISGLEPVGNYALKIIFSDGHQSGFYTWEYLATLVAEHAVRWPAYEAGLTAHGLSRTVAGKAVLRVQKKG